MIRKKKNGIEWLEFALLAECTRLKHCVFLRHGGCSSGDFTSLNFSYRVGDRKKDVAANRKKVAAVMGINKLAYAFQCHGKKIVEVFSNQASNNIKCDALATSVPNLGLLIAHADCQAAIFYDPIHKAVANVHAGWRGSVQNIYREAVQFMKRVYGSSPQDLLVAISPSLGPEDAEFIHYREELPEPFWGFQVRPCYFDFWEISRWQLKQCGILPHHIEIAGISTYSSSDDYFSYRRNKVTGRHGTVVFLTQQRNLSHVSP